MSVLSRLLRDALFRTRQEANPRGHHGRDVLAQAVEYLASGRSDQALALCTQAVNSESTNPAALHLMGTIMAQRGEYQSAEDSLRRALAADPHRTDAWVDLGNVLRLRDACDEALACYAQALEIDSLHVLAFYGMAQLLAQSCRANEAIDKLHSRVVLDYDPLLLRALVALLVKQGRFDTAKQLCEQALVRNPDNPEAHSGAGYVALTQEQNAARALAHFDRAVASISADADLLSNRGIALQQLGRVDEAIACYEQALFVDRQHHAARVHRALALLAQADYERGWEEYEHRRFGEDWATPPEGVAEWQGEELSGKSIYVYAEQGIGDEVLFASCLPDLLGCARQVMVECDPRLMGVFIRSFPDVAVFNRAERLTGVKSPVRVCADRMVPIATLPRYFRKHPQSFVRHGGYLCANEELVANLRVCLEKTPEPLKVGISWRGGTPKTWGNKRSIPLGDLLPVLQIPGISWVSVQYGNTHEELADLRTSHGLDVKEFPEVLADFDHAAALVCALDLVISVDNAIANLCGGLGRPGWVALALSPDWRYGMRGDSTPWYPSLRLFRQTVCDEWRDVIAALGSQLLTVARRFRGCSANSLN